MLLVRSTTENYGRMTEFINPFNKALALYGVSDPWNIETASGLMRLSNEIQRQPAMIGYVGSFHLLSFVDGGCAARPWFMRLRTVHV